MTRWIFIWERISALFRERTSYPSGVRPMSTTSLPEDFKSSNTSSALSGVMTIHSTGSISTGSGGSIASGSRGASMVCTSARSKSLPPGIRLQPLRIRVVIRISERRTFRVDFRSFCSIDFFLDQFSPRRNLGASSGFTCSFVDNTLYQPGFLGGKASE